MRSQVGVPGKENICMYVNFVLRRASDCSEPMKNRNSYCDIFAKFGCKATKFAKEIWVIFCETLVKPNRRLSL